MLAWIMKVVISETRGVMENSPLKSKTQPRLGEIVLTPVEITWLAQPRLPTEITRDPHDLTSKSPSYLDTSATLSCNGDRYQNGKGTASHPRGVAKSPPHKSLRDSRLGVSSVKIRDTA